MGWERAAEHYVDAFGGLTAQTAGPLLAAAGVVGGTRLLDVASGPGFIAGAAAALDAEVTGLDFSAAMMAEARRRHPAITFREGDAEALPFEDSSFDAVVMNFGLLHLARPEAAIVEALRVLRPGGRYAFTIWAAPERAIGFGMALRVDSASTAIRTSPLPEGPPFFRFSDADESRRTLEIDRVRGRSTCATLPLVWRLSSADAAFDAMSRGGVRTAAVLRAQTAEALAAIRAAVRTEVESYARDGEFRLPMPAVLAGDIQNSESQPTTASDPRSEISDPARAGARTLRRCRRRRPSSSNVSVSEPRAARRRPVGRPGGSRARDEMRIPPPPRRRVDFGRQAHVGVRKQREPRVTRPRPHHALHVISGRRRRQTGTLAESRPELLFERAERQPLTVGGLVDVVARLREIAGRREGRPLERGLVNRDVDRAAGARACAIEQRGHDRQRRLLRRSDVADERTRQRRRTKQSGERLVVDVVRGALDIRTVQAEAADRRADDPRMTRPNRVGIDAKPARGRRPKAFDEDVGAREQCVEHSGSVRRSQIEGDAALAAIERLEKPTRAAAQRAHRVAAARILDLDDVRAEIDQQQRRIGARQQARQVEDADAVKRLRHDLRVLCSLLWLKP